MESTVLVPVDGSDASESAVEYAVDHFTDATLTLLYVMDPMVDYSRRRAYPGYVHDEEYTNERERGEAVLETAETLVPSDRAVEAVLEGGRPAKAIVRYADEHDVDHLVIGSHGRSGPIRYVLGSVAESVVRNTGVPVTVVRPSSSSSAK